jgi:hypothetical protein
MKKRLQRKFINILVKHLFNGITEEDVLVKHKGGKVSYRRGVIPLEQLQGIEEEAQRFQSSMVWKLVKDEIRFMANKRMFVKSNAIEDILFGKTMLYVIEMIDRTLIRLSNISK